MPPSVSAWPRSPYPAPQPPTRSRPYTAPGTYTLTIPPHTTAVNVIANGGGGTEGGGGATGGAGSEVNETIPVGPGSPFAPGDSLTVIIGARGGGGAGGRGNELGSDGGQGGGATIVADTTGAIRALAVAGGGGGGGGKGGIFFSDGGAGGEGNGRSANGASGAGTGRGAGGGLGQDCNAVSRGGAGGSAGTATDAGGGGGGGDGAARGSAGGAGGGGGGGGGAGQSLLATNAVGTISTTGYNHDGNVALHFTRADVAPQITSPATTTVPLSDGNVHFAVVADSAPAAKLSLTGAPSWLSIDPTTGVVSGAIPANTAGRLNFSIIADNGVGTPATQDFTLEVTAPRVVLTPPQPIKGIVDLPVSAALSAHGGAGAITWSVASGALPAGLVLTSDGELAGTPTAAGSATFTARATDSGTPTASSATETVTVVIAPRVLAITSAALPAGVSGQGYEQTLTAAQSVGRLTWSVADGSLPPGLFLIPFGKLVGTPTSPGTYAFTLQVTDATGTTATAKATLVVQPRVRAAVFVVNGGNSAVHSFALDATGNASPLTALSGSATGLNGTTAVAIAANGRVYVASANNQSIREYVNGATGNTMPDAVIAGPSTGLGSPQALLLDGQGRLYVANAAADTITVYAPGASGDAKPLATLGGPHTGLSEPVGAHARPRRAPLGGQPRRQQPHGVPGRSQRRRRPAGHDRRLRDTPQRPAGTRAGLDRQPGRGRHLRQLDHRVLSTANGNVLPIRRIAGTATGLSFPVGIDVDASRSIWVSNQFGGVE